MLVTKRALSKVTGSFFHPPSNVTPLQWSDVTFKKWRKVTVIPEGSKVTNIAIVIPGKQCQGRSSDTVEGVRRWEKSRRGKINIVIKRGDEGRKEREGASHVAHYLNNEAMSRRFIHLAYSTLFTPFHLLPTWPSRMPNPSLVIDKSSLKPGWTFN